MLGTIGVSLVAAAGLGIGATDAHGLSLAVKIVPSTVNPRGRYTVTITGTYAKRTRPPYLLAFIQYAGGRCRPTATAEYRLPQSQWDWDYHQHAQATSPFRVTASWTAGPALGTRHVCAYLYARHISPASTIKPVVRASASFSNTAAPAKTPAR